MNTEKKYCGFTTIIGRPNVGKSTLINQLLRQKISITSRKPQTTQQSIMGIDTRGSYQAIYIDTPGFRIAQKYAVNRLTNRAVKSFIDESQFVIFVVEGIRWTADDEMLLNILNNLKCRVLLIINKVDKITNKPTLLPHIKFLRQKMNFLDIVPISAEKGININTVSSIVQKLLPEVGHHFPNEYITNRPQWFMASEIIREKLMRLLGDELPYSVTVKVEQFIPSICGDYKIYGLILVERESQKKIVIGKRGHKIKAIGMAARIDMEKIFNANVHLELRVQVQSD